MALFKWNEKFSVNIQEMDQQHKKLIGLIDSLHDARQANKAQEGVGKVLDELVEYTKIHFKREEELMEQHGYPCSTTQKSEHNDLVYKVLDMQKKYYTGDTSIATDVAILLNDWLAEHILIEDKRYGLYISDISVNIQEMDQQHKKLIDITTDLCNLKKDHIKQDKLRNLLDKLTNYPETHFKKEEELMKQWVYPDYGPHKLEHESIVQQILNIKNKFNAGHENIVFYVEKLVSEGLINHIFIMDKKYGPYLNSKGIT